MNRADFQVQGLGDPRLAVHATSAQPAWLWSTDGTRILWANPVGAQIFGASSATALARKEFGPADPHRRQIAQLASRLPQNGAVRLERLRGFGAAPGMLATCACSRLDFFDGSRGVLIASVDAAGRSMPLVERLQRLVQDVDTPIAAFARDGMFIGASDAARPLLGFRNLSEAGLDRARHDALAQGRVETAVGIGHMVLQRVGHGADIGLVALIVPSRQPVAASPAARSLETSRPEPHASPAPTATDHSEQESLTAPEPAPIDRDATQAAPAGASSDQKASPDVTAPNVETAEDAPSPYAEAVADLPVTATKPSWLDEPLPSTRQHPLRFMWQMDDEGRFSLGSDEFTRLIGFQTAAGFGRPWSEIAAMFGIDPEGRVMKALATHDTWSGITLDWPVDGGGRLPVELSGLPIFDRERKFAGYRGFGVCRDLDGLARLAALRRYEVVGGPSVPISPDILQAGPAEDMHRKDSRQDNLAQEDLPQEELPREYVVQENLAPEDSAVASPTADGAASPAATELPEPTPSETSQQTGLETIVETQKGLPGEMPAEASPNVVPFRNSSETKPPSLTPVENSAFNELARQLSARLENETGMLSPPSPSDAGDIVPEQPAAPDPVHEPSAGEMPADQTSGGDGLEWLTEPEPAPRGESRRDKALLDLLPAGVLIYRLDRLLYANAAFLERTGYDSLQALEEAGGLDGLYVGPGVSNASSTSGTGTPVTISASQPADEAEGSPATEARLYTISWDGDSALALIFSETRQDSEDVAAAIAAAVPLSEPSEAGHADAEDLGAILDTAAEGIVMFDADGKIHSANRSAEALFGYSGDEFVQRNLADLFEPESQHAVFDYLASLKGAGVESLLDHGREALGRVRQGGIVPLSVTMGRTRPEGPNFFAVFRDLSQTKKSESELREAKQLAERAAHAKADMLARISHEIRAPLNAIVGFSEVMITERFGTLGNERYVEYIKDIRASGERVLAIINDLLDLSRIETGKLDLSFADQNLNEMVESCVAVMQPQANRERIIIRTSLAPALPAVIADARALRQITLNLIGNSIHLANAGGQVIVSTALSDFGEVMLRVRDTGQGLNDNEVAAAMEPFRTGAPSDQASDNSGVSLSLTKALVEANRAKFQIKTGGRSGTLIEVVFSGAVARA